MTIGIDFFTKLILALIIWGVLLAVVSDFVSIENGPVGRVMFWAALMCGIMGTVIWVLI